jgi:hypothetical protein
VEGVVEVVVIVVVSDARCMMARFVADQNRAEGSVHILLIATGSVASIKAPVIVQELLSVSPCACNEVHL